MGNIYTVGPNEALVVSGGWCGSTQKRTIVGGWAWAWWAVTDVQTLSLETMTLNPICEHVETAQGVPLTVTGVAQCKIIKQAEILKTASEQFLGKTVHDIELTILQTLEGHLRSILGCEPLGGELTILQTLQGGSQSILGLRLLAPEGELTILQTLEEHQRSILGTLTVEEIFKDRDQFAALVREVAAPDVGRMGVEILSFTIKDVYDSVEYLSSLGRSQTAAVKRDADVGVAIALRDAGIREAECERAAMDIKYGTDTKIEDNTRSFKMQKAQFDREVNTSRAEAQLAYELQEAKEKQKIRTEEIAIDIIERKKQIEVEEQEVRRKEKELMGTVKLPAEAESYKLEALAEGKRFQTVELAKAEAENIKLIGTAEAISIEAVGRADAERMRMKAAAYRQYGDAAMVSMVLEALPKIAAEIAAPLSKVDEMVMLGGQDNLTSEITRLVGQLPPAVSALTGVDLSKVLGKIPGAEIQKA